MGYYKITQLKMPLEHDNQDILSMLNKKYGFPQNVSFDIAKKSVDARKKQDIQIVYNLNVHVPQNGNRKLAKVPYVHKAPIYQTPLFKGVAEERPVIIGAGPAGLFAAMILAEAGTRPLVFERGQSVDERMASVAHYFETGELNTRSNIQFGEGGAGTFSDGKINTGVKDRNCRIQKIVETFIDAGAPEEIRYVSKPHIGTDYLVTVVRNIRQRIIELGGDVKFNTKVDNLLIEEGRVKGVQLETGEIIKSNSVVLSIGHSARDTFEMLVARQVPMVPKAFAIGLRIEHPQEMIARSQYGEHWQHRHLPVADYKLTYRTEKARAVYTFCMCPGGFVVNSASEHKRIVCNGMSNFARDEVNANSAVLVNVHPEDFDSDDILAGVAFQRKWEEKAFEMGGSDYSMPVQTFQGFCNATVDTGFGDVQPNCKGSYRLSDLNGCLPAFVSDAIKEGIGAFGRRIRGFDRADAVLTGIESRSSSPVRMDRDENFMSPVTGLYPCGEGAGYAGGIMSAAIDGIKVAEAVVERMTLLESQNDHITDEAM